MTSRAQELFAHSRVLQVLADRYGAPFDALALCAARAALLSTLRKQHLRLVYFEPERARRALLVDLRAALDADRS